MQKQKSLWNKGRIIRDFQLSEKILKKYRFCTVVKEISSDNYS